VTGTTRSGSSSLTVTTPYYAQPATGNTVTIPGFNGNQLLVIIDPAGTLATLTITLPAASDGQRVVIACSQIVTALTLNSAAGSILGAITTIAANALGTAYCWSATANKWFRC